MEVCRIRGRDAGGKMDYLSDCWGAWGGERGEQNQTGGQNEESKVNTPVDDDESGARWTGCNIFFLIVFWSRMDNSEVRLGRGGQFV